MKTKFLMLAFVAILFAACSVDQDENILDNSVVELSTVDSTSSRTIDDCKSSGGMIFIIEYNLEWFPLNGGMTVLEWKESARRRFIDLGLTKDTDLGEDTERWFFQLDEMTPENAAKDDCRNETIRGTIDADKDVDVDEDHGCIICGGL